MEKIIKHLKIKDTLEKIVKEEKYDYKAVAKKYGICVKTINKKVSLVERRDAFLSKKIALEKAVNEYLEEPGTLKTVIANRYNIGRIVFTREMMLFRTSKERKYEYDRCISSSSFFTYSEEKLFLQQLKEWKDSQTDCTCRICIMQQLQNIAYQSLQNKDFFSQRTYINNKIINWLIEFEMLYSEDMSELLEICNCTKYVRNDETEAGTSKSTFFRTSEDYKSNVTVEERIDTSTLGLMDPEIFTDYTNYQPKKDTSTLGPMDPEIFTDFANYQPKEDTSTLGLMDPEIFTDFANYQPKEDTSTLGLMDPEIYTDYTNYQPKEDTSTLGLMDPEIFTDFANYQPKEDTSTLGLMDPEIFTDFANYQPKEDTSTLGLMDPEIFTDYTNYQPKEDTSTLGLMDPEIFTDFANYQPKEDTSTLGLMDPEIFTDFANYQPKEDTSTLGLMDPEIFTDYTNYQPKEDTFTLGLMDPEIFTDSANNQSKDATGKRKSTDFMDDNPLDLTTKRMK
ncbi:uncharacterized protein [Anoplolepis gracilipes]|uniref:uncharacterized protein n=1 Tax=Anoplolepis gracilipes TaxID=354296 RepID=UPI003BA16D47